MKRLLTILIFSIVLPIQAINIKLLKGTHTIKDVPEGYAPFWGLTFIECDIAQQWYQLSPKIVNKEIENYLKTVQNPAKQTVLDLLKKQTNNATENLVAEMFHIAGGTFSITNAPDNPVRQLTPYDIGKILRIIHDALSTRKKKQDPLNGNQIAALKTSLLTYMQSIRDKNEKPLKGLHEREFKAGDFNSFINPLVSALQETLGKETLYAANTVQGLLLGFMLIKSNDKTDFTNYFRGFLNDSTFKLPEEMYTDTDFTEILQRPLNITDIAKFADYVCAQLYTQLYASSLPKITSHFIVSYKTYSFPDCVESTMLNLANIVTYNQSEKLLGNKLPEDVTMDQDLKNFYTTKLYANPAEVSNLKTHNAWANIVENVPGAIYQKLGIADSPNYIIVPTDCEGFVPVAKYDDTAPSRNLQIDNQNYTVQEKTVDNKKYLLIHQSQKLICFELRSKLSNIIVIMNRLLNLDLYKSEDQILTQEFAAQYFKNMCDKLGWDIADDVIEKMKTTSSLNFQITLKSTFEEFTIHLLDKAHTYLTTTMNATSKELLNASQISTAIGAVQSALVALNEVQNSHVLTNKILKRYIPVSNKDQRIKLISNLVPVVTDEHVSYLTQLLYSFSTESDPYYINTIASLLWVHENIGKIPSISNAFFTISVSSGLPQAQAVYAYLNNSLDDTHIQGLLDCIPKALSLNVSAVAKKLDQVLKTIDMGMQSTNPETQRVILYTLESLIMKNLVDSNNIPQVLACISTGMKSTNPETQKDSLYSLRSLIDKNLINSKNIPEVFELISTGMKSTNPETQKNSLYTLELLIMKNLIDSKNIPEVFEWISTGMKSTNFWIQTASLNTLESLRIKNLINSNNIPQILACISIGMKSTNHETQRASLYTLESLITSNLIDSNNIPQVLACISIGMQSTNHGIPTDSLYTLSSLINKNLIDSNNIPQVFELISIGMKSPVQKVSNIASIIKNTIEKLLKEHELKEMLKAKALQINQQAQHVKQNIEAEERAEFNRLRESFSKTLPSSKIAPIPTTSPQITATAKNSLKVTSLPEVIDLINAFPKTSNLVVGSLTNKQSNLASVIDIISMLPATSQR